MDAPPPPDAGWRRHLPPWLPSPGRAAAAAGGTAAAVALAVLLLRPGAGPPAHLTLPRAEPGTAPTAGSGGPSPSLATVHVAGAVAHPGLYSLPAGSRVADALVAAGGPAQGADSQRLNLAAPLADGERIWVPREGEGAPAEGPAPAGADGSSQPGPLDLNRATLAELDTLPGVGPATARAIVAHRERNGPFRSVSELTRVPGIGPAKLEVLRPLVRV